MAKVFIMRVDTTNCNVGRWTCLTRQDGLKRVETNHTGSERNQWVSNGAGGGRLIKITPSHILKYLHPFVNNDSTLDVLKYLAIA